LQTAFGRRTDNMISHGFCPNCLDKALKNWLGRKAIAENRVQQAAGILSGYQVNGRSLKVLIQEGKHLHVIQNVTKLTFQDRRREEIELLDRE